MSLRLGMILAVAAAVLSLLGLTGFSHHQAVKLRAQVAGYEACEKAVKDGPKAGLAAEVCSPEIALADQVARMSAACNAALTTGAAYGVKASCSEPVKALQARAEADAASLASATTQLDKAAAGQAQAVARAEARATTQTERSHRAQAVTETAPRDAAGLRVYDAGGLRLRWSQ